MEKDKEFVRKLIETELRANISVLIDPKRKDSFSDSRVQTWTNLVADRIIYHLIEKED
jgi:hypothetical protein